MEKVVIRDCTLYRGDCLEMLETIPPGRRFPLAGLRTRRDGARFAVRLNIPLFSTPVPNEVGRVLYDELQMIDRYDGLIFLTKLGVMYLKNRGLV